MTTDDHPHLWQAFEAVLPHYRRMLDPLIDDAEKASDDARGIYAGLMTTMAYADRPEHPMASSVYFCSATLAVFLAARQQGVDAHAFGRSMLSGMRANPPPPAAEPPKPAELQRQREQFREAAAASQEHAEPGEFVFEAVSGRGEDFDWGINITSCAICHAYARHDAMDLVPYLCATDDVTSDWGHQGLRRTGTIAVGAHHCDFRFHHGQPTDPLADHYPDRIRLTEEHDGT